MKTCTKCGATKRSSGFYSNARTKDGLRSECKECSKENTRRLRNRKKFGELGNIAKERDNRLLENINEVMQLWQSLTFKMEKVVREAKDFGSAA